MKETVRSLRMYFGMVAILGGVLNALVLIAPAIPMPLKAVALLSMATAAAALYIAIALPTLLRTRLAIVLAVVALLPVTAIAGSVASLLVTGELLWINPIISIVIAGYLYVNVKRLAAEPAVAPA